MRRSPALAACLIGLTTAVTSNALTGPTASAAPTSFEVRTLTVAPEALSPNGDGTLDSATVEFNVGIFDTMDVRWWVETLTGLRTGVSGSMDDVAPDDTRDIEFPMEPTGLSDGSYRVRVQVKYADDPTWLSSESSSSDEGEFSIDLTPPPTVELKRTTPKLFYPIDDGFRDVVFFENPAEESDYYTLIVTDDANHEVYRRLTWYRPPELTWSGTNNSGRVVREGTYDIRYELSDAVGNTSVSNSVSATVSRKRLVWNWWTKKVTPAASMVDRHVGRCSTLSRPSARGWAGSIGLYSNTRCRSASDPSLVATVHSVRVPRAREYGRLRVAVDGGAATSAPRSVAVLRYLTDRGRWEAPAQLDPSLRHHPGQTAWGDYFIRPHRRFVWAVATARGAQYDVKLFTVKVWYMVLGYHGRCILCPDDPLEP